MLCFPPAKINLGLHVVRKRDDGFHDLETVFYPLPVWDALECLPGDQQSDLFLSGLPVSGRREANLVWKALALLQHDFEGLPSVNIYLHKHIPMGAGLGGGSSDGAWALRLLNDYFRLGCSRQRLMDYALTLGSDCPVFIENRPCFATGRGEQLTPSPIDLSDFSIQLICPDLHIATAWAFSQIVPEAPRHDLRQLGSWPISTWPDRVSNAFEPAVFSRFPDLKRLKEELYRQGALYAAMSGTGSTIFGVFPKGKKAAVKSTLPFREFYCAVL